MLLYKCVHGLATNVRKMKKRGEDFFFGFVYLTTADASSFYRYFSTPFFSLRESFCQLSTKSTRSGDFCDCVHASDSGSDGNVSFSRRKEKPSNHLAKRQKFSLTTHSPSSLCPLRFCFCFCSPLLYSFVFFGWIFFPLSCAKPVDIGNGKSIGSWNQISIPLQR